MRRHGPGGVAGGKTAFERGRGVDVGQRARSVVLGAGGLARNQGRPWTGLGPRTRAQGCRRGPRPSRRPRPQFGPGRSRGREGAAGSGHSALITRLSDEEPVRGRWGARPARKSVSRTPRPTSISTMGQPKPAAGGDGPWAHVYPGRRVLGGDPGGRVDTGCSPCRNPGGCSISSRPGRHLNKAPRNPGDLRTGAPGLRPGAPGPGRPPPRGQRRGARVPAPGWTKKKRETSQNAGGVRASGGVDPPCPCAAWRLDDRRPRLGGFPPGRRPAERPRASRTVRRRRKRGGTAPAHRPGAGKNVTLSTPEKTPGAAEPAGPGSRNSHPLVGIIQDVRPSHPGYS